MEPKLQNGSQLSEKFITINEALAILTACLSICGTVFIVISYFAWKDIQSTSRRILVYISVADFFTSVGTIMGKWSYNNLVCTLQSTIGTLAVLCTFFWTAFMAIYLYVSMTKKPCLADKFMILFHIFGWGTPAIIVMVADATNKLGNNHDVDSSGWCWVNAKMKFKQQILWMLLAGKGWEIAAYVIIIVFYALVRQHIKNKVSSAHIVGRNTELTVQRVERKLMLIPLVFISLRIWSTIRFLIYAITGTNHRWGWILIMQAVGDNGQGFANFLLFCFFTERAFKMFRKCCGNVCLRRRIEKSGGNIPGTHFEKDILGSQDKAFSGVINDVFENDESSLLATSRLSGADHPDNETREE